MTQPSSVVPDEVIDQAIDWLIRLEMSDHIEASQLEFEQWLQQSSEHQLAWERVKSIRGSFSSLPSEPLTKTIETLNNYSPPPSGNRRQVLKILSISGLMLSSGFLTKEYTPWQRLIADYSTAIGQQQHVTLADGSQVILNTDSALSVDLAGKSRKFHLRRGEMNIKMTTDESHKSVMVKTPVGRISALATSFTLRLEKYRAQISVHEGRLKLLNRSGLTKQVVSGESYWFSDQDILPATQGSIPMDAWVMGAIAGKNIPLGELLDELSRYRVGIIDYAPEIKDHLVSGVFQLQDTDTTLKFLAQVQSLQVEFRTPYWVVIRPA